MLPPMGLPESGDFVGVPVIPSNGIITSSFVDLEGADIPIQSAFSKTES